MARSVIMRMLDKYNNLFYIIVVRAKNDFETLINTIYKTHCVLQEGAVKIVDQYLTIRNWLIGFYIVEYEQNGHDRAKYGTALLDQMGAGLKQKGLKGLHRRALNTCRIFYLTYPQIWLTVSAKLRSLDGGNSLVLPVNKSLPDLIHSSETEETGDISPELLLSRLSYSHFIELIRIEDSLQRLFYEVETIKNNWSVRDLKRAIETSLALRTTLSKNKHGIIAKIKNLKPAKNVETIKDPYILEFLGLEEKSEYTESDLEQSILNNLQKFLMELGTGFCFEARQKRITFNNKHYRIDMVFYHRILKCHVLIDLKIGEFDHANAGQMNLYLNYYKDNEMSEGDNDPIGIILCADKDDLLVKYSTYGMADQLFVSKYLLKLPDKQVLEDFLKKELGQL